MGKKPSNEKWKELVDYVEYKVMTTCDPIEHWIQKWAYDQALELSKEQIDYLIHHARQYKLKKDKSLH